MRWIAVALTLAVVFGLAGFLIGHFAGLGPVGQSIGWGMCLGGALAALVTGQSGSPSRMTVESRWGAFGQYWGQNPALPQSPLWLVAAAVVVGAAGIAIIVLTY